MVSICFPQRALLYGQIAEGIPAIKSSIPTIVHIYFPWSFLTYIFGAVPAHDSALCSDPMNVTSYTRITLIDMRRDHAWQNRSHHIDERARIASTHPFCSSVSLIGSKWVGSVLSESSRVLEHQGRNLPGYPEITIDQSIEIIIVEFGSMHMDFPAE